MHVQLTPDFIFDTTAAEFNEKSSEFKITFDGPGFYLTDTNTILVLPKTPEPVDTLWFYTQPENMIYTVFVYNRFFSDTIFAFVTQAPVRVDNRGFGPLTMGA